MNVNIFPTSPTPMLTLCPVFIHGCAPQMASPASAAVQKPSEANY